MSPTYPTRLVDTTSKKVVFGRNAPYCIISHKRRYTYLCSGSTYGINWNIHVGWKEQVHDICNLASKSGFQYMWIDILCIDQNNEDEKFKEIQNMRQYYSRAELCFSVLDDTDDGLAGRLTQAAFTCGWMKDRYNGADGNMMLTQFEEDQCILACREADKLARCIWFKRVWTLQEYILSDKLLFWTKCDCRLIDRDTVIQLRHAGLFFDRISTQRIGYIGSLSSFSSMRRLWNNHDGKICFSYLYSLARNRECEYPEDIVYGVMGMLRLRKGDVAYSKNPDTAIVNMAHAVMEYGDASPVLFVGKQSQSVSYVPSHDDITEAYGRTMATHGNALCKATDSGMRIYVTDVYYVCDYLEVCRSSHMDVPSTLLNTGYGSKELYVLLMESMLLGYFENITHQSVQAAACNLTLMWAKYSDGHTVLPSDDLTKSFIERFPWIKELYGETFLNIISPALRNRLYAVRALRLGGGQLCCVIAVDNEKNIECKQILLFNTGGRGSGDMLYLLAAHLEDTTYKKVGVAGPAKYTNFACSASLTCSILLT